MPKWRMVKWIDNTRPHIGKRNKVSFLVQWKTQGIPLGNPVMSGKELAALIDTYELLGINDDDWKKLPRNELIIIQAVAPNIMWLRCVIPEGGNAINHPYLGTIMPQKCIVTMWLNWIDIGVAWTRRLLFSKPLATARSWQPDGCTGVGSWPVLHTVFHATATALAKPQGLTTNIHRDRVSVWGTTPITNLHVHPCLNNAPTLMTMSCM